MKKNGRRQEIFDNVKKINRTKSRNWRRNTIGEEQETKKEKRKKTGGGRIKQCQIKTKKYNKKKEKQEGNKRKMNGEVVKT